MDSSEPSSPLLAKSVAMVILFSISLTLGALPMFIAKRFKWEANVKGNIFAHILLSIGGGVLMSTTFIHLLPEVTENAEKIEEFKDLKFPVAETFTCVGFFLIYLVEESVHLYLHKHKRETDVDSVKKESMSSLRGERDLQKKHQDIMISILDLEKQVPTHDLVHIRSSTENWKPHGLDLHNVSYHSHEHNGDHSHLVGDEKFLGSMRGLMVVLALSVHEVLEGLGVGLEEKPSNVWYMFAAVGAHKFIIAFCVGVELLTSGIKNKLIFMYVFTFAVVSPIGIAMGMAISSQGGESSEMPSVILQGFATGTLLYVIFFEILKKRDAERNGMVTFSAVFFGFLLMFLAIVFLNDEE